MESVETRERQTSPPEGPMTAENDELAQHEVCRMLGVSRTTLWRLRLQGYLPQPIGERPLRWSRLQLRRWIGYGRPRANAELAMAFRAVQLRAELEAPASPDPFDLMRFAFALRRVAETFTEPADAMRTLIGVLKDLPADA
jgi:predicted DNA-binding transcriptional regulator AlpA